MPIKEGIQVGPLPSLGGIKGPTCEYLYFMPRYRGIKSSGTPTGPTCEYRPEGH